MLEFVRIRHPDQIKSLLRTFNPERQTWIVSDLRSKQEIQAECISRFGFYSDDSILRISDFWRLWIRRLDPTLKVVSSDFIRSLVQSFVNKNGAALELFEGDQSTLEKYVQELAPIILHPESDSVLQEWLQTHKDPRKWQTWYKIARTCLLFIVNEKKVIDAKWSAAYLQSLDLNLVQWPYEIIVDLGTELTSLELGLFKVLSQKQNVQVYVPSPAWSERFPFLLKTYIENLGSGKQKELSVPLTESASSKKFIRLSTQLAEVKYAVAQVRSWLDADIKMDRIAIIGLQIEEYWPVLQSYLDEEGIPYQKDVVASVNSLSDTQIFLAHLKSYTQDVSFESLQQKIFQSKGDPQIKYEKFKSLFNQLFDEEDLKRNDRVQALFYKKIDFSKDISRDEFISVLLQVWSDLPESSYSEILFELLFKDFLAQSLETVMSFANWFQFFKARISHKEMKISYASEVGIHVLPLMSAQMTSADHRIYIGLYEEAFRTHRKSILPLSDIEILKNQFDLAIPYPEESHLDFNLRWQTETKNEQVILTSPHLSFSAEPLTPCLFFLENNPQSDIQVPEATRLDEMQRYFASKKGEDFALYQERISPVRLRQDLQGVDQVQVKHTAFQKLSVSEVEAYARCGFKLLASKGFRLRELPEVSIDLDPRQKGVIVHALFEFLIGHIAETGDYDVDKTKAFLQTKREELGLFVNEDVFWSVQLNKLMSLAQNFFEFERFRIQNFKVFVEKDFEIFFDLEKKQFVSERPEKGFAVRGRIDRIDQLKETHQYIIYDYKSSAGQISNYKDWMSERQFQLLIYLLAVETGLFPSGQVKGTLYYLYKDFNLTKGLIDRAIAEQKLNLSGRIGSLSDDDAKQEIKENFINFIAEQFALLEQGQFTPRPFDKKICDECDWRKLCRSKHLM